MESRKKPGLGPLLGVGNDAEIHEWGEIVAKLYRSSAAAKRKAFHEASILASVGGSPGELSIPAVWGVRQIEGRWAVLMDRADGPSFADVMRGNPDKVPGYLARMAQLHLRLHQRSAWSLTPQRSRLTAHIGAAKVVDEPGKRRLLAGLRQMPDGDRLCHGDFHPLNILGDPARAMIVDWLDATQGDPAADVCRSYLLLTLHAPEMAEPYVDSYLRIGGTSRARVFAWLPFIAAARLAEDVPSETDRLLEMVRAARRAMD